MTNNSENPQKKALEDLFANRVYEGYKNRSQEFNKTFGILLAFAAIFMLLIQAPYTLIKSQQASMDQRLLDLQKTTQQLDLKTGLYSKVLQGVDTLRTALRSGPEELRSKIMGLARARERLSGADNIGQSRSRQQPFQQQIQQQQIQQQQIQQQQIQQQIPGPANGCGDPRSDQWLSCEVQAAVSDQFNKFRGILEQHLFEPLQELAQSGESIDIQNVQQGLDDLQNEFWETLKNNRQFWLTFSGKVEFFDELNSQVSRFWNTHAAEIEKKASRLRSELQTLKDERAALQDRKAQLVSAAAAVEKRIASIESPFGKLPVGLAESIALYPLIIAFGFALVAAKLISAIQLRHEIFKLWRTQDPKKQILTDDQINLMAPLNAVPAAGKSNSPANILLLFSPLLIYAVACLLILYTWTMGTAVSEEELLSGLQPLYGALYVVATVVLVVTYWKIFSGMARFSNQ